ncbi:MAG: glycosyltransferase [Coriobacteriia bacterium]|nr:glycosyltransferase [Coriobacteriia bacterium]
MNLLICLPKNKRSSLEDILELEKGLYRGMHITVLCEEKSDFKTLQDNNINAELINLQDSSQIRTFSKGVQVDLICIISTALTEADKKIYQSFDAPVVFVDSVSEFIFFKVWNNYNYAVEEADRRKEKLGRKDEKLNKKDEKLEKISADRQRILSQYEALSQTKLGKLQTWLERGKRKASRTIASHKEQNSQESQEKALKELSAKLKTHQRTKFYSKNDSVLSLEVDRNKTLKPKKSFASFTNAQRYNELTEQAKKISSSNGSKYYTRHPYRVGIISDRFLYESLRDSAETVFIQPDIWQDQIKDIDVLFVASTWRGLEREWWLSSTEGTETQETLFKVIDSCRASNIKTVFYSKEDPVYYDRFLPVAKRCEFVFTTSAECIPLYKDDCKHNKVFLLLFGVNPLYHNPIGHANYFKHNSVLFSGSWYSQYFERCKKMYMIFEGTFDANKHFEIIDRNHDGKPTRNCFPEKYWAYVVPTIDHDVLQSVHKLFEWSLGVNTVTFSTTMFANRSFELLALGALSLSNYSAGLNAILPEVFIAHSQEEVTRILNTCDKEYLYSRKIMGIRSVMSNHDAYSRMGEVLKALSYDTSSNKRSIAVVVQEKTAQIEEMFANQSYQNKKLIEISEFDEKAKESFDAIAFWDATSAYECWYLEDLMNAFKYTNSDYITKDAYIDGELLVQGDEHSYVSIMKSKYRTLFWASSFTAQDLLLLKEAVRLPNGYSIDHLNYCTAKGKTAASRKRKYKISVIVPVYNNGRYLYTKAFGSLLRSSVFEDSEILLIDGGSTDLETRETVKLLERQYPNVKAHFLDPNGNDSSCLSISLAKNKGIELAVAKYLTFLNPESEALHDGYAELYKVAEKQDCELVVGESLEASTDGVVATSLKSKMLSVCDSECMENKGRRFIAASQFALINPQGSLVAKELIENKGLRFIEGITGEDALFGWELMLSAKRSTIIDTIVSVQYLDNKYLASACNKGDSFEQLLAFYQHQKEFLTKNKLLEKYMKLCFEEDFENAVLKKLLAAETTVKKRTAAIVVSNNIYHEYADVYTGNNELIKQFVKHSKKKNYEAAYLEVLKAERLW